MKFESNVPIQEGKYFERNILHTCEYPPEERLQAQSYMKRRDSIEWAKKHQPEVDYSRPETMMSPDISRLKTKIQDRLPDVDHVLRFYTAVDSPLDYAHKVDAFFELDKVIVTIDLTLNPNKINEKAHVIITGTAEEGLTEDILEQAAVEISEKFNKAIADGYLR